MPRKLRIEYAGATYHIISQGNYRKDLFVQKGTGEAFERTIFETVQRCGWELYAYVIMHGGDAEIPRLVQLSEVLEVQSAGRASSGRVGFALRIREQCVRHARLPQPFDALRGGRSGQAHRS